MESITYKCRFLTPAFLGGADPRGTPELRPSSIKGALRFWWRAQSGIEDVAELKEREMEIFGGVEGKRARKSSFIIRTSHENFLSSRKLPISKVKGKSYEINIFEYLAYGTYDWNKKEKRNNLNRDFVEADQTFTITFSFKKDVYKEEVIQSFQLLSMFGGIGSKSRNGYGQFLIDSFEYADWKEVLKKIKVGEKKKYTAFSQNLICFQTKELYKDPITAIAAIGKSYKDARENIEDPHIFEDRSYIGSPIIEKKKQKSGLDRHTKPYFFTAVKGYNLYRGVLLYLPYLFLDEAGGMLEDSLKEKRRKLSGKDLEILEDFLRRPIKQHQEFFIESNELFHEQLTHIDNEFALIPVQL